MIAHAKQAEPRAGVAAAPSANFAECRLRKFRPEVQSRVRSLAARNAWIADLSLSFPALLFALAFPRAGIDAPAATRLVATGAPLAVCAQEAGVAMWLRGFPAEAFATPIPVLPDSIEFRRRIANHKPRPWRLAPQWLEMVSEAAICGDEEIALWFAREAPLRRAKRRKRGRMSRDHRRLVCLWAWWSRRAPEAVRSYPRIPWKPSLQWKAAHEAALKWRADLALWLYLGAGNVDDVWLEAGRVDGYEFHPLRTVAEIEAEAAAMANCVSGYGSSIAGNDYRLWSVRKDGARIATMSLNAGYPDGPLPCICELSGKNNTVAPLEVWRAARRWLFEQDARPFDAARLRYKEAKFDAAAWRETWRLYWIAKRRIPDWLPLAPSETCFFDL